MDEEEQRTRIAAALAAGDRYDALGTLAEQLRDSGHELEEVYALYLDALDGITDDDPRHDEVLDVLDRIEGGGWARGRAIFDRELDQERFARWMQRKTTGG